MNKHEISTNINNYKTHKTKQYINKIQTTYINKTKQS